MRDRGAVRGGVPAAARPLHLHVRSRVRLRGRHRRLLHAVQPAQVLGGRVEDAPLARVSPVIHGVLQSLLGF